MSERVQFIARVEEGETVADLAREFGISEKTAYKFLARWKRDGVRGLEDQSHSVERIPHRTPQEIIDLVLAMRREFPNRGGVSPISLTAQRAVPDEDRRRVKGQVQVQVQVQVLTASGSASDSCKWKSLVQVVACAADDLAFFVAVFYFAMLRKRVRRSVIDWRSTFGTAIFMSL